MRSHSKMIDRFWNIAARVEQPPCIVKSSRIALLYQRLQDGKGSVGVNMLERASPLVLKPKFGRCLFGCQFAILCCLARISIQSLIRNAPADPV